MSSDPTIPLSATRWATPLIRAPLSVDTNSSGSELDPLSSSEEDSDRGFSFEPDPEPALAAASEAGSGLIPVARVTNDDNFDEVEESFDEVDGDGFPIAARVPAPLDEDGDLRDRLFGGYPRPGEAEGAKIEIFGFGESEIRTVVVGGMSSGANDDVDEVEVLGEDRIGMENDGFSVSASEEIDTIGEGGIGPEAVEMEEIDVIEREEDEVEDDLKFEELESDASEDSEESDRVLSEGVEGKEVGTLAEIHNVQNFEETPSFERGYKAEDEKVEILSPEGMVVEINDGDVDEAEESFHEVDGDGFPTAASVSALFNEDVDVRANLLRGYSSLGEVEGEKIEILGFGETEIHTVVGGIGPEVVETEEIDAIRREDDEVEELKFEELQSDSSDVSEESGRVLGEGVEGKEVGTFAEIHNVQNFWETPSFERGYEAEGEKVETLSPEGMVVDDDIDEAEDSSDEVDGDGFPTAARVSALFNEDADVRGNLLQGYSSLGEVEGVKLEILGFGETEIRTVVRGGMSSGANDVDDRIGMESNERNRIFEAKGEKVEISGSTSEEIDAIVEGGIGPEAAGMEEINAIEKGEDAVEDDLKFEKLEADASDATEETGRVLGESMEDVEDGTSDENYNERDLRGTPSFGRKYEATGEKVDMLRPYAMAVDVNDVKIEEDGVGEDLKIEVVTSYAAEDVVSDRVINADPNSKEHHKECGVSGEDHNARGNPEEVRVLVEDLSAGSRSEIVGVLNGSCYLLVNNKNDGFVECELDDSKDGIGEKNEENDALHGKDEILNRGLGQMSHIIGGEMSLKPMEGEPTVYESEKDEISGEFEHKEVKSSSAEAEEIDPDQKCKACGQDEHHIIVESPAIKLYSENVSEVVEGLNAVTASAEDLKKFKDFEKTFDAKIDGRTTTTASDVSTLAAGSKHDTIMTKEEKKFHKEVESIRVKFLRLVHRLGRSSEDIVVASVLYHLACAEDMKDWLYSFSRARIKALELEMGEEKDKLNFSCNILVIGKTGVGKSATINSIFEEEKSATDPFKAETKSVKKIHGVIDGVKIQIIDTPGLCPSLSDQTSNWRVLSSINKYIKKCPADVILYMDRLDTAALDFNDLPLLRLITKTLGPSIWSKAIVALSHAGAASSEGPTGLPFSYEEFVDQRSQLVQHLIHEAAGDASLMNPVVLVENHPSFRRNRRGQRSQLLLSCYSSKILSDANSLSTAKGFPIRKLFDRVRSPPIHLFLSSLLESKVQPKLSSEIDANLDLGGDLDDLYSDEEHEEDEYDQMPPFRSLTKSEIGKLSKEHRRAYLDEYNYRVKLLEKKMLKQEIRRVKEIKRKGNTLEHFDSAPTTSSMTPLPDMVSPPSFDSDDPVYCYRSSEEPCLQLLTGPLLDPHTWDHDCGLNRVSIEKAFQIAGQFPAAMSVKLKNDEEEFSIQMDSTMLAKYGNNGSTLASYDIDAIGDRLAYCFGAEASFGNLKKKNKTTAGFSVNFIGDTFATGIKLEDSVYIRKTVNLTLTSGAIQAEDNVGYGAILETALRDKDQPTGQALGTLGLSLVSYNGNLVFGGALQSQVSAGRNSKVSLCVGLNNRKSGQITIRTSSSEQLQMVLLGLASVVISILRRVWPGKSSS